MRGVRQWRLTSGRFGSCESPAIDLEALSKREQLSHVDAAIRNILSLTLANGKKPSSFLLLIGFPIFPRRISHLFPKDLRKLRRIQKTAGRADVTGFIRGSSQ